MQERLSRRRKSGQRTTPWMEDDCRDAGGRATQGAVAEVEPRLEQRSRSSCRSGCRGRIASGTAIESRKGFRLNTALHELLFAFLAFLHPRLRRRYFLRSPFPVRYKARGLPSFVSRSCFTRKSRADHPWSARSPRRASTGPSPLSDSPVASLFSGIIPALRCPYFALAPAQAFLRSRCPASLERPGRAVRGTPVHRAKGPLDPFQCSGSPMAWAFGGAKVHWTFAFYRLTPRTFILARFTPVPLLR